MVILLPEMLPYITCENMGFHLFMTFIKNQLFVGDDLFIRNCIIYLKLVSHTTVDQVEPVAILTQV